MKLLAFLFFISAVNVATAQEKPANDSAKWKTTQRSGYAIQHPSTWTIDTSKRMGVDLFLFSPKQSDTDKFSENVNMIVQDLAGFDITLDQYMEINEAQIKEMLNEVTFLESKRLKKDSIEFHKLVFTSKQGQRNLQTEQYYYVVKEKAYVATLSIEASQVEAYKKVGEAILDSFVIVE